MVDITKETREKTGFEVIICNGKKHIEKQLVHSNLPSVTLQYSSDLRKQRQELQDCGNKQPCRRFLKEDFAIQIIMDGRTTPAVNFKTTLGFKQHNPIMRQEQSTLSKIKAILLAEEILFQHHVLSYFIDAYFPKHKLTIEVDEQGHNSRDIDYEIERQKAKEKELDCKFIRINPAKANFDIFIKISKIQNYICKSTIKLTEESTNKSLIDKFSDKLEFKSNNSIKQCV